MMILVSILVLSVLVFVHELGHFLFAKFSRVGVLEFAIGFGKPLWRKTFGETSYSIRLIPLGGYVKMVGDELHDVDPSIEKLPGDEIQAHEEPAQAEVSPAVEAMLKDKSRWFLSQPVRTRFAIVLAGPLFNLIFAIALSAFSYAVYGKSVPVDQPIIGHVIPGYPAEKSGLKSDDRVMAIDEKSVKTWEELASTIFNSNGKELNLLVERKVKDQAETFKLLLVPQLDTPEMALANASDKKQFKIGIVPKTLKEPVGLTEAIGSGFLEVYGISRLTLLGMGAMISGVISPNNIAGPIFIFKEAASSAQRGLDYLFGFMVFLSVSLAILNLLPIPVLDGGHLAFFIIEAIKGKPLSFKIQAYANQFGMLMLLLLMVFALSNDIMRLF